jgi:hypothetical protein
VVAEEQEWSSESCRLETKKKHEFSVTENIKGMLSGVWLKNCGARLLEERSRN